MNQCVSSSVLVILVAALAGCAQKEHPHQAAARIKNNQAHMAGAQCLHSIRQAETYDDKTLERRGVGVLLSSLLGPLSWPINKLREDEHDKQKQAVVAKLESDCKRAPHSQGQGLSR